ncbi:MAG: tRNA lysidine(34) synthetase TilS [Acidobacteriaceae bacterium]|nr:tRNA lysidine(34) synthetase TilS [Acidobacteriaceae bacterium]
MTVLSEPLIARIGGILTRYSMLPPHTRAGIAVSGGADSVVLLHILHRLAGSLQIELLALHVNHHLRGAESDADEQFVRELARDLGIDCAIEHASVQGSNLEEGAREARRAFFFRLLKEQKLVSRVALGHTASDQAETVLFRLLRGTGLAGLAGMSVATPEGLLRPLLTTSRREVRAWAQTEGIAWREDSSNQDPRFARNRLRNEFLPALAEQFNPKLEDTLARMALLAQAEEDYWAAEIEAAFARLARQTRLGWVLDVPALKRMHVAVQRRIIRRMVARVHGDLRGTDAEHIEAVLALCDSEQGHDRVLIPGADALRSFGQLLMTKPGTLSNEKRHYRIEVSLGAEHQLPFHSGLLCISPVNEEPFICVNFKKDHDSRLEVAYLDGEAVARHGSLFVRNWEPGDQILRSGHQSAEKLKSLFQEHRVLLWDRRHWPVVVSGDEVVWARGFGVAATFRGTIESRRALRVTYRTE